MFPLRPAGFAGLDVSMLWIDSSGRQLYEAESPVC